MRLDERQFDLLTISILTATLLHATHIPIGILLGLLAVLSGRWIQRRLRPQWGKVPAWLRLPLTLALPAAVLAEYGTVFGLDPGSVLAVGMLVLKLSESERPRDARAALTFASFVLMAALLFEQDLIVTIGVCLALLPIFLTLRALEPQHSGAATPTLGAELRGGIRTTVLTLLAGVPLAVVCFLFLPRLTSPLWATPNMAQGKSGVSDSMSPGRLGQLLLDDTPAFRVSFDSGAPPPIQQRYWRGLVLWRYDGTTWSRMSGQPDARASDPVQLLGTPFAYDLTLEPTNQRWMFALDLPTVAPRNFIRDGDYSLSTAVPITKLAQYRLQSALTYRLRGLTDAQRRLALALPAGYNPRAIALGKQWATQFTRAEDIVQQALKMISADFTYTLEPPPLGRHAMDDFLFETRAGYCEYFSSAFAVLMRAAGVPTRVVVGYQGGYWNPTGEYMVVRQSDAHAWNEVWYEDRGWVRIDPTAAVRPERVMLGSRAASAGEAPWYGAEWVLALRNRWDLVNRFWNQVVVQFDEISQQGLLRQFGIERADWRQLAIAFALSATGLLGIALLWALRRERDGGDAIDRAYRQLGRRLARFGLARADNEGPADYLARVRAALPASALALESVFARYVELRYAQSNPTTPAIRAFRQAVRQFRPQRAHGATRERSGPS